jgi:acylphosphatase
LGLTGWVRNLDDGRVEMLIAGEEDSVETMVKWAHRGPPGAHVESVEVSAVKEQIPKDPFYIRRDGGR